MKNSTLKNWCMLFLLLAFASHAQESYTWNNAEIVGGGFVPGIVYNESEPGLVYARTDIGGAYIMNNATNRWEPLLDWVGWDEWGYTGVVSLATDPVDPDNLYLAVGTYTNSWDPNNGAILKSTDRGATFSTVPMPFKMGGNMPGRGMGERLAIDPNDNSILYLGTPEGNGLWKSTDAGNSWSQVTNFPNLGHYADDPDDPYDYLSMEHGIVWVTFDKSSGTSGNGSSVIYVGVADTTTSIYKTTDGGASWSAVPGQPTATGFIPHKGKLDPVNGYLYLAYSDDGGPYGGEKGDVYRYNTATGEWLQISPYPSSSDDNFFGYSGLTIDRQNPNIVMVTGYSSWWPDTQIWRSLDFGVTWTRIWDWTRYPDRSFRYVQDISEAPWLEWGGEPSGGGRPGAEVYPKLGWMTETLEIDPFNSDKMMYGTGATIYGTDNLTEWDNGGQILITVKAMGLEETAIQELVRPPGGPLLSGMYDVYGFAHSDLNVVPNEFFSNPRIATVSIDYAENNPNYVFRVGEGDEENEAAGYSTDGGFTWSPVSGQPSGVVNGNGTCAVNADGSRVVWSPNDAGVHYSTNDGQQWTASTGIPAGALVESDRVNPNKFYAFSDSTFYVSNDGGASFAATATGLPSSAQFKAAHGQEGHIWMAGYESGVLRSVDGGNTFTNLGNADEADNIGFGKAAPGQSYVAIYSSARVNGVRGIYRSINEGASWERVNDDQHQYAWTGKAITGDPDVYGRVYVATNGRGIIYGDIASSSGNSSPTVAITNPTDGATFVESTMITINASASDSDGTVTQVEFFADGSSIGTDTDSPYEVSWSVAAGITVLTAIATDNDGATGTSQSVSVTGETQSDATTMHVESLTATTVSVGQGNKRGQATVKILDDTGAPVASAHVSGTFSGSWNESASGTTDTTGTATIQTSTTQKGNVSADFCVDNLTHSSLSYDDSQNVVTCTGSGARVTGEFINELNNKTTLTIYPNPVTDRTLNLNLEETPENPVFLSMTDMHGRMVLTTRLINAENAIRIPGNVDPGIYFIQLYQNNKVVLKSKIRINK